MTKHNNSRQHSKLLQLQILEYIERYHPELKDASIEINPGNTLATVHIKGSNDAYSKR